MLPVYADYMKELEGLSAEILKAIDGLPPEALDWMPGPDMNSITVLVAHLTGSQRFLIGDLIGGIASNRVRAAEFETRGLDGPALAVLISRALETVRLTLEKLTIADLESTQPRTKDGRTMTVSYALSHALGHTGTHAGHIQLTRQLWQQRM